MSKLVCSVAPLLAFSLLLAACGEKEKDKNLAGLDAELTNNSSDPALHEALEAPIASDPDLAGEANRDAVRPGNKPLNGAVPARLSPAEAKAAALKLAGGKLMPTPAATRSVTSTKNPVTLAEMAEQRERTASNCGSARIEYAAGWASRMPAAFPVYPGGTVNEAAGANNAPCNIRAVSFTTSAPLNEVMDFYYTMARRAGYSVEHLEENGENVLGGARDKDEGAYYISFRKTNGGTAVDLIANGGR